MKILLIALIFVSVLFSDEMQRVQNIVEDITKLRVDYEKCQKQLSSGAKGSVSFKAISMKDDEKLQKLEVNLSDEKQRNKILLAEIDVLMEEKENSKKNKDKIKKLEKTIKNQEISLKSKEKTIKKLKMNKAKIKEVSKNSLNSTSKTLLVKEVSCKEKNSFPKLVMKEGFESKVSDIEETHTFTPSAFRLKNDASIYDDINGKEIYFWEKSTSFTSNEKSDSWVRITGYFINKKWLPSKKELWVKSQDVIQR